MIQHKAFLKWLQKEIPKDARVLDIGCGNKWYQDHIEADFLSIDAFEECDPDILLDLEKNDLPSFTRSFDLVLMLDVIEHLTKERGKAILQQAQAYACIRGRLILLTPLWFDDNAEAAENDKNPFQLHKSVWTPSEFPENEFWMRITEVESFNPGMSKDPRYHDGYYLGIWKT